MRDMRGKLGVGRSGTGMANALRRTPDGCWKMAVIGKPGNDVPVQMGNLVSQAGKIDFVRIHQYAQATLDGKHHPHQVMLLFHQQVAHFGYMRAPDHPAITRIIRFGYTDNMATSILP